MKAAFVNHNFPSESDTGQCPFPKRMESTVLEFTHILFSMCDMLTRQLVSQTWKTTK